MPIIILSKISLNNNLKILYIQPQNMVEKFNNRKYVFHIVEKLERETFLPSMKSKMIP